MTPTDRAGAKLSHAGCTVGRRTDHAVPKMSENRRCGDRKLKSSTFLKSAGQQPSGIGYGGTAAALSCYPLKRPGTEPCPGPMTVKAQLKAPAISGRSGRGLNGNSEARLLTHFVEPISRGCPGSPVVAQQSADCIPCLRQPIRQPIGLWGGMSHRQRSCQWSTDANSGRSQLF